MTEQVKLSRWGGGDTDDISLSLDPGDGYDLEARERVRAYAEEVATGGWTFTTETDNSIWFEEPDPESPKTLRVTKKGGSWTLERGTKPVGGTGANLQDALDQAGEWMAAHPVDGGECDGE